MYQMQKKHVELFMKIKRETMETMLREHTEKGLDNDLMLRNLSSNQLKMLFIQKKAIFTVISLNYRLVC